MANKQLLRDSTVATLLAIAERKGFLPVPPERGEKARRDYGLVLKAPGRSLPIVLHTALGVDAQGDLIRLHVAVAPSEYQECLENEGIGIAPGRNQKTGSGYFAHSIYRCFAHPLKGREPTGRRYCIEWDERGPNAFTTLLAGLR